MQNTCVNTVCLRVFQTPKMRWNVALTCVLVALSLADCGSRAESSEWSWGKGRDRSIDGKATGKVIKSLTDSQTAQPSFKRWYSLTRSTNSPHFLVPEGSLPYTQQPMGNILSLVSPIHILKSCQFTIHFNVVLQGADKSLARLGRKQATATEDFEFHISYL